MGSSKMACHARMRPSMGTRVGVTMAISPRHSSPSPRLAPKCDITQVKMKTEKRSTMARLKAEAHMELDSMEVAGFEGTARDEYPLGCTAWLDAWVQKTQF